MMDMESSVNSDLIRGHVDTIILNVLMEKDRYGYEILELIDEKSHGRYAVKQPTLYSCLKRLEKQGFISSYYGDETNGARRRYYTLSQKGYDTLHRDQREWEYSRSILDKLLSDKQIDLKSAEAPFDATSLKPLTKRVKAYDVREQEEKPVSNSSQPIVIPITLEAKIKASYEEDEKDKQKQLFTAVLNNTNASPSSVSTFTASIDKPIQKEAALEELKKDVTEKESVKPAAEKTEKKVHTEEDYRRAEQRAYAARLLQIGDFSNPQPYFEKALGEDNQKPSAPAAYKDISYITEKEKAESDRPSYKEALSAIFMKPAGSYAAAQEDKKEPQTEVATAKVRQFNDLKQSLLEEGYKVKQYSKANSSNYYYMNYIYSNKLMRDTMMLTFLVILVELLVFFILKDVFQYSTLSLILIGVAATVIPVVPTILWSLNPTKRTKAKFNFSSALVNSLIAFILLAAINTVISLFVPSFEFSFDTGKIYVPYILALNIPLAVVLYHILYKSKNYHLKS